jgi:hydrogenase expression/formation protein HypC
VATRFRYYHFEAAREKADPTLVFSLTPLSRPRAYDEIRMCLAIPGKIIEFHENQGVRMSKVDFGGITREACLEYIPDAKMGDYVMVHVGFAISKVDEEEAARTYQYLAELGQLIDVNSPDIDTVEEAPDEVP